MKITPIAVTKTILPNADAREDKLYELGAKVMGVCVNTNPIEKMQNETIEKVQKRKQTTLTSRHHSGYGMEDIALGFEDVSRIFCMYLHNLRVYDTEETSGRHTKLNLNSNEKVVFDYFYDKIYNSLLADSPDATKQDLRQFNQIALENARYVTGIGARTSMVYKTTLRQWNYIYGWTRDFLEKKDYNAYEEVVIDDMKEFYEKLGELEINGEKLINHELTDPYKHGYNLFSDFVNQNEVYDADVYKTFYKASTVAFMQLHRHRQINFSIDNPDKETKITYYTPQIIKKLDLVSEWQDKIDSIHNVPQARLLQVMEVGQPFMVVDRLKERACNYAQEETRVLSTLVATKVFNGIEKTDPQLAHDLKQHYLNKNRCSFPDYRCPPCRNPCTKADVIKTEDLEELLK